MHGMPSIINRGGGGVRCGVKNNDELIGSGGRSGTVISGEKRCRRNVMLYNIIYSSFVAETAVRDGNKTAKESE